MIDHPLNVVSKAQFELVEGCWRWTERRLDWTVVS